MHKVLLTSIAAISLLFVGCSDSPDGKAPKPYPVRKEAKIEADELKKIKALSETTHPEKILRDHYRHAVVTQQPKRAELYLAEAKEAAQERGGATMAQIENYALAVKTDLRSFMDQCEKFLEEKNIAEIQATLNFAQMRGYADFAYFEDSFVPRAKKVLEDYAAGK